MPISPCPIASSTLDGVVSVSGAAPGADAAAYYARRAVGGASLVITEGVYIDHLSSGDNPTLGRLHDEAAFSGWRSPSGGLRSSAIHGRRTIKEAHLLIGLTKSERYLCADYREDGTRLKGLTTKLATASCVK